VAKERLGTRSKSVISQPTHHMEHSVHEAEDIRRRYKILHRSKQAATRKHNLETARLRKEIESLQKESTHKSQTIVEKEKEVKLLQIKLREFLQKNMTELPVSTFEQIEDIIEAPSQIKQRNGDIYGTKSAPKKRMAETYKRVKEISAKYGATEQDLEVILSKFMKGERKKSLQEIG
jgi:hypothetical protein